MSTELELKFDLAPELIAKLQASKWLGELGESGKVQTAASVYFDTPEHSLRKHGISLRVRHIGNHRIQTLKRAKSAAFARPEWEAELDGDQPDLSLLRRRALKPLRAKRLERKLMPIFETRVERRTIPVQWNGSQIEIAIDLGSILANGCTTPIHEVEFELKVGTVQSVVALASRMLDEIAARYGLRSKAERGYALAARERLGVVRAESVALDRAASVADAFRVISHACLRHFALNEQGVLEHASESVHQMRIGLRRLRAALSVFKTLLNDPESRQIKEELRWLTEQLGPARDYDVLVNDNQALRREAELHAGPVGQLQGLLCQRFSDGLAQAAAAVASDRFRRIVATTALWMAGGHWAVAADPQLRTAREVSMRRFAKRMFRARTRKPHEKLARFDELDDRQRHELRIDVKKLHYATEFVGSLFVERDAARKRFTKLLKRIQDSLGELNDRVVHERIVSQLLSEAGEASVCAARNQIVYATGLIRGHEDAELQQLLARVHDDAARLARHEPFWR